MEESLETSLLWTTKYKPTKGTNVLHHHEAIEIMREWLNNWGHRRKQITNGTCDESTDEEIEDDSIQDSCLIITGPPGIGKTSSVYAVAKELNFRVFEMNCSSKRSGKIVTESLHEATQSRHVGRVSADDLVKPSNNLLNYFSKHQSNKANKTGEKNNGIFSKKRKLDESIEILEPSISKKNVTNSLSCSSNSLILFDDVDIIFKEDEAFWKSVKQLIAESKKPVIFTITRFVEETISNLDHYKLVHLSTPSVDTVVSHLQNICEKEKINIPFYYDMFKLVLNRSCDVRQCMNQIQFDLSKTVIATSLVKSENKPPLISKSNYDSLILCDILHSRFNLLEDSQLRRSHLRGNPHFNDHDYYSRQFANDLTNSLKYPSLRLICTSPQETTNETNAVLNLTSLLDKQLSINSSISVRGNKLAFDYCPYVSAICSAEVGRLLGHSRRTRRFFHYLDSASFNFDYKQKAEFASLYNKLI